MSTQNALWLIQNPRPIFRILLPRNRRPTPKNKALTLQAADVKTGKVSGANCALLM